MRKIHMRKIRMRSVNYHTDEKAIYYPAAFMPFIGIANCLIELPKQAALVPRNPSVVLRHRHSMIWFMH